MKRLFEFWEKYILSEASLCSQDSYSAGWIDEHGTFLEMGKGELSGYTDHYTFAKDWLSQYDPDWKSKSKHEDDIAYLINEHLWIRVANAFNYEGPDPKMVGKEQWANQTEEIWSLLAKCATIHEPSVIIYETFSGNYTLIEPLSSSGLEKADINKFIDLLYKKKENKEVRRSLVGMFREQLYKRRR